MFGFRVSPDTFSLKWMLGWPGPCSPPEVAPSSTKPPIDGRNLPEKPSGCSMVQHDQMALPKKHQKLDGTGLSEHDDSIYKYQEIYFGEFPQDFQTTPSPRGAAPLPSWRLQALHGSSRPGRQSSEKATSLSRSVQDSTPISSGFSSFWNLSFTMILYIFKLLPFDHFSPIHLRFMGEIPIVHGQTPGRRNDVLRPTLYSSNHVSTARIWLVRGIQHKNAGGRGSGTVCYGL